MAVIPASALSLALELNGESAGSLTRFQAPSAGLKFQVAHGKTVWSQGMRDLGTADLTIGSLQPGPLLDWFSLVWRGRAKPANLAVVVLDQNQESRRRLEMLGCLVSRIAFTPLDATTKDLFEIQFSVKPAVLNYPPAKGKVVVMPTPKAGRLVASNFRAQIPGLSGDRVTRIELPNWTLLSTAGEFGEEPDPFLRPPPTVAGPLRIEVAAAGFDEARELAVKSGLGGEHPALEPIEMEPIEILIECLDPSLKQVLARFTCRCLGPIGFVWTGPIERGTAGLPGAILEFGVDDFVFTPLIADH